MIDADFEKLTVIYEEKNLSNAALRIGISQSALSKVLVRLEDKMEVPLFTRTNRGLIPTEVCEAIYRYAKDQELQWKAVVSSVTKKQELPVGFVKLASHPILFHAFRSLIADLVTLRPHIQVDFIMTDSVDANQMVINGDVDMALVVNPRKHSNLIVHNKTRERVAGFQKKKSNEVDYLIYNPGLIQSYTISKSIKSRELVAVESYELAAELASLLPKSMVVLPQSVARRYGLNHMATKPFYVAQIGLVRMKKNDYPAAVKKVWSTLKEGEMPEYC